MRFSVLTALFFFLTTLVSAQSTLDPVTISSSLQPVNASKTGRNIFVITGSQMAKLPVHSLDELLRYLPGVEVQSRGPFGSQSDIVMRGGTFQQVLVIVDGLRVNDPNTGHFTAYVPIAPSEIERIEIVKGASSAIYGSDAVGGVINIITKTFAAKPNQRTLTADARVTIGAYTFYDLSTGVAHNNGRTAYSISSQVLNTDGQLQRGTRGAVRSSVISASVSHYFSPAWQLAVRTGYDSRRFGAQNFYTTFVSDTAEESISSFWNAAQLSHTITNHKLQLSAGYKALTDSFSFNPRSATNQNKSRLAQLLVTDTWQAGKQTSLVYGVQGILKKIVSNDRGNHTVNTAAAFVITSHQLTQRLTASPSVRVEWNSISGTELIPQLNLSYHTPKIQVRASAGKTTRDADFTERYNNYNKAFVGSGRLGNPDLIAERSVSYEGGADYMIGSSLKISATLFQRRHKQLIDYVTTPYAQLPRRSNLSPTGIYALAKNISRVTTSGLEADLQYNKTFQAGSLWAVMGLVWLDSESSDAAPSFYVSSHARLLTNFSVSGNYKRLTASLNGLYKTRQEQQAATPVLASVSPDYFLLNARLELLLGARFSVFAELDNVTDKRYTDLLGTPMPRRWVMGGIKISLPK